LFFDLKLSYVRTSHQICLPAGRQGGRKNVPPPDLLFANLSGGVGLLFRIKTGTCGTPPPEAGSNILGYFNYHKNVK